MKLTPEQIEEQRELFEEWYFSIHNYSDQWKTYSSVRGYAIANIQEAFDSWLKAIESQPKREIRLSEPARVIWADSPKAYIFVDDLVRQLEDQNIELIVDRENPWVPI